MLSFSNIFANIAFALGLYIFDKIAQNKKKKAKKLVYVRKNSLLCTLFCGSSLKAAEKDALGDDMRPVIGATDTTFF